MPGSISQGLHTNYGLLAKLTNGIRPNTDLSKNGSDLTRGPNLLGKIPAAAWSNTWPTPQATLDLDFANDRGFVRGVGQGSSMQAVTFTRASSANWVDSAGVLRTGAGTFTGTANAEGKNLLTFPQDFDNAAWTKTNATVTANTEIAPDGTLSGDKLIATTTNGNHFTQIVVSPATTSTVSYTWSVYAKVGEYTYLGVFDNYGGNSTVSFDLNTGTQVSGSATGITITSVGNGWWRISRTVVSTGGNTLHFDVYNNSGVASYAGDGTSGIYIWGAQLEVGSSATTYYPTNINVPRFDWASTAQVAQNIITNSEAFNNWTLGGILAFGSGSTVDAIANPVNGEQTADLIVENTAGGGHNVQANSIAVSVGQVYTVSVYVKRGSGLRNLQLAGTNQTTLPINARFNLTDGTVITGANANIETLSNGWFRCSQTITITAPSSNVSLLIGLLSGTTDSNYTGDGTSGLYLFGAQLELKNSVGTYQATGAQAPSNTPLAANSTCNGLLIEESRANRILWCRDATGALENLLNYSEQFDNAYWTKTGLLAFGSGSVANTPATTDPLGGNTADLIEMDNSTGAHGVSKDLTTSYPNNQSTFSVYLKYADWQYVALVGTDINNSIVVDLINGTIVAQGSQVSNATISAVGATGWYRVSYTMPQSRFCSVQFNSGNTYNLSFAGTSGAGFYIWGAQLSLTSFLTNYVATTAQTFTAWAKSVVTLSKNQTGIDGVANSATSITATSSNGTLINGITLASGSRTGSVYLKRITGTGNIQVSLDGSTWSTVELSSTEWRRIVLSGTVTNPTVGIRIATNGDAVAMDYAQVEDGAFATSPILTTTASVTRSADVGSINITALINNSAGTFYHNAQILGWGGGNQSVLETTRTGAVMPTPLDNIITLATSSSANNFRQRIMVNSSSVEAVGFAGAYGFNGVYPYNQIAVFSYSRAFAIGMINGFNNVNTTTIPIGSLLTLPPNQQTLEIRSALTRHIRRIFYIPNAMTGDTVRNMSLGVTN